MAAEITKALNRIAQSKEYCKETVRTLLNLHTTCGRPGSLKVALLSFDPNKSTVSKKIPMKAHSQGINST